jgi:hypothetical protein
VTANVEVTVPDGIVYLIPTISVPMAAGAMAAIGDTVALTGPMSAALMTVFLQPAPTGAIAGWTLVDDNLEAEKLTSENIARRLTWTNGGLEVANKCSELYTADLFAPFAPASSTSSPPTPMDHLISAKQGSGSKRRKHSKPSSLNGTAGMQSVVPAP